MPSPSSASQEDVVMARRGPRRDCTALCGILLVLCVPVSCWRLRHRVSPVDTSDKERRPLFTGIYDAYHKNLKNGVNLASGREDHPARKEDLPVRRRSDEEDFTSTGEYLSRKETEDAIEIAGSDSKPYAAAQYGYRGYDDDDDGYGDDGYGYDDHGYGDDDGYGDTSYGYDDGYRYGDGGYYSGGRGKYRTYGGGRGGGYKGGDGYGGRGEYGGYGYGEGGYDGGKGGKYGGHGGGGYGGHGEHGRYGGGGEGHHGKDKCKCDSLGIIGTLTGFSTIPALVTLLTQQSQAGTNTARALNGKDHLLSRLISHKENSNKGGKSINEESHFASLFRDVRDARSLSTGYDNSRCDCTLSLLGSIAGFASLTTLLGFALAQTSSNGGDAAATDAAANGGGTRKSIATPHIRNITANQDVVMPSLANLPPRDNAHSSMDPDLPSVVDSRPLGESFSREDLLRIRDQLSRRRGSSLSSSAKPRVKAGHGLRRDQERTNATVNGSLAQADNMPYRELL